MRFGLAPDFDAQEEDPMVPVEDAQIAHLELLSYRYRLERWRQAHNASPTRQFDDQLEPITDQDEQMLPLDDLPPICSLPSTTASSSTDSLLATPSGEWWEPLRLKECKGAGIESREMKKWGPGPGQSFGPGPRTMAASENLKESRKRLREDDPKEERHNSLGLSLDGEDESFTFKRRCSSERSMSLSSTSSKRSSKGFIKPTGRVSGAKRDIY